MTVAELIAKLNHMPRDMTVHVSAADDDNQWHTSQPNTVEIQKCYTGEFDIQTQKGVYIDGVVIS